MSLMPRELNQIGDDVLEERVNAFILGADAVNPPKLPVIAPFITAEVMLRLHNLVVVALGSQQTCQWSKQATLAGVVGSFTGVTVRRHDAEYVGNAQDSFLKNYCLKLKKAKEALTTAKYKAKKSGRQLHNHFQASIDSLGEQIYHCRFVGVPRNIIFQEFETIGDKSAPEPIHKQPIAIRKIEFSDEVNLQLKRDLMHQEEKQEAQRRESQKEWERMKSVAELWECACKRAERLRTEGEQAFCTLEATSAFQIKQLTLEKCQLEMEAHQLKGKVACLEGQVGMAHLDAAKMLRKEELLRHQLESQVTEEKQAHCISAAKATEAAHSLYEFKRQADRETEQWQGKVARLEGQLVMAHQDAAKMLRKEELLRHQLESQVTEVKQAHCISAATAKQATHSLNEFKHQADRETEQWQGKVARLEGQLVRTHVHTARLLKKEQHARQQVEKHSKLEVLARRIAEAKMRKVTHELHHLQRKAKREAEQAKGKILILEGKVVQAQMEAARATQRVQKEVVKFEALRSCLNSKEVAFEEELQHMRELKAKMAKRARDADARASSADQLQCQLDSTRQKVRALRKELASTRIELSHEHDSDGSNDDVDNEGALAVEALQRVRAMPQWQAERGLGRGAAKIPWGQRVVIYTLLALLVPPSAVGLAIVSIVKHTAPWLSPKAPTHKTIQRCRFVLRYLEEALSARRIASAYRVRSIGFDETTKLGNASLTSNVQIEPKPGAAFQDVICRAAYCPLGGTAEMVVKSIEGKCFSRLRDMLRRWRTKFEEMYPGEDWTGPDPSLCSLSRLGGGGAIITDTCNTARKSRALLQELIASQSREQMGEARWEALSDAEQKAAVRTHGVDCWQHLRNIFLAEMSCAQAAHVQVELKEELDTFASWERMTTDFAQVLRACFKEFHHSCRYYKGKGRAFNVWLRDTYPKLFCMHLERADGGRQDLDYDAAVPIYIDRKVFVEYLHDLVFVAKHSNVLEDFLYVILRSLQFVAMARANAIVDLLISRPLRWLSGKSSSLPNWSPFSMGEALDLVEEFFEKAQHDGSLFLDPDLDIFKPIALKQPAFEEWRRYTFSEASRIQALPVPLCLQESQPLAYVAQVHAAAGAKQLQLTVERFLG